ncbi:uncharacterized protein [Montipora foliosa]|uniref:uncharacterized protein isoform X2 n=1 Tax=Montipora foliosa TaxID=591990 RepID=UPI0035F1B7AB
MPSISALLFGFTVIAEDDCRELVFPSFFFFAHKLLVKHNITTIQVCDLEECKWRCYQDPNCVSVNIHTHKNNEGLYRCELNNATHLRHGPEFLDAVDYFYHGADSACDKVDRCANGAVCQSGYTDKGYRCVCPAGGNFANCQQDIDECVTRMHNCCKDAVCNNTKGSYTCSCKPGYFGDGYNCTDIDECFLGNHTCSSDANCINTNGSYNCTCKAEYVGDGRNCSVQVRMAWFPLNATFNTSEINNRVSPGFSKNVTLAKGPDGREGGSYEFQHGGGLIKFSNNQSGYLDMRYSVTILYWLYHLEFNSSQKDNYLIIYRNGTRKGLRIFDYRKSDESQKRIIKLTYGKQHNITLRHQYEIQALNSWRFLGTTYNRSSGEAKFWVNGTATETKNIGKDFELGTQYPLKIRSHNFKGRITQLRIYNCPLTQEQIQKIKGQFKTPQSGGESETIRLTEASISGDTSTHGLDISSTPSTSIKTSTSAHPPSQVGQTVKKDAAKTEGGSTG